MKQLDSVAELSLDRVKELLSSPDRPAATISELRVLSSLVSSWAKYQQTRSAHAALTFMMAREVAGDRKQLIEILRAAMPDSPILEAIKDGVPRFGAGTKGVGDGQ